MKRPTTLKPFELLVKTVVASLCHTDLLVQEGMFGTRLPCTASHEGAGVVVTVGSSVTGFKKGDRVMSGLIINACGQCEDCRGPDDWHQYCTQVEGHLGTTLDGAFAQYHVTDSRTSCLIPDGLSFSAAAPLACAGRTIYRAIDTSGIHTGQSLAIVGAGGGLGHLGVQFALARGLKVIAIDARDEALRVCEKAGAKHVLDARKGHETVVAEIRALSGGGVDATINVSAHPTSAALACAITTMHGTMVQVSAPSEVSIPIAELVFRDIRIKGTLLAGRERSMEMLAEFERHKLRVECSLFYGLEQVPAMLETMTAGTLRGKAACVVDEEAFQRDQTRVAEKS